MLNEELVYRNVTFFEGQEYLPNEILISLDNIRGWAIRTGLIWDEEAQLLGKDRLADISNVITSDDELEIAIAISKHNGKLDYLEYPFISVKSLIKRGIDISIVYWRLFPNQWTPDGSVIGYGEVRFGFWLKGCGDEFCSVSTGKMVVKKFLSQMKELGTEFHIDIKPKGIQEIIVEGAVIAKFVKEGRMFDVVLSKGTASD